MHEEEAVSLALRKLHDDITAVDEAIAHTTEDLLHTGGGSGAGLATGSSISGHTGSTASGSHPLPVAGLGGVADLAMRMSFGAALMPPPPAAVAYPTSGAGDSALPASLAAGVEPADAATADFL